MKLLKLNFGNVYCLTHVKKINDKIIIYYMEFMETYNCIMSISF